MSENSENIVNQTVKYAYLRDPQNPERVLTIARRWGKNGNKVHYAYAICRPDADQFNKAMGRTIASGRLQSNPTKVKPLGPGLVLRSVVRDIFNSEDSPRLAKNIAASWLLEEECRSSQV